MADPEVVIVGAGAAGVGAGLELAARGVPFVILEAGDRIGGRAFTDAASLPQPWDRGCQWFHSADVNPLVDWADRLGIAYRREGWFEGFGIWTGGGWAGPEEIATARAEMLAGFDAIDKAAARGDGIPVADAPARGGRWDTHVRYILALMCGDDPERVSASGYADYHDTGENWTVTGGFGRLVARMGEALPVRTGTRVLRVGERPGGVRVETADGALDARAAIVTVSTGVLLGGGVEIGPGPARDVLDLVPEMPCGVCEKVAVSFSRALPEIADLQFILVDQGDGVPLELQVAPGDPPMLVAHMAGNAVRDLVAAGEGEMCAHVIDRLAVAFGSGIRGLVRGVAATGWHGDPLFRGAYSHPRVGGAEVRRRAIAMDTGRIVFAGEAFSLRAQGTAHGAYLSGRAAAARIAGQRTGLAPAGSPETGGPD